MGQRLCSAEGIHLREPARLPSGEGGQRGGVSQRGNAEGKERGETARKVTKISQASTTATGGGKSEERTTEEIMPENQGGNNVKKMRGELGVRGRLKT